MGSIQLSVKFVHLFILGELQKVYVDFIISPPLLSDLCSWDLGAPGEGSEKLDPSSF